MSIATPITNKMSGEQYDLCLKIYLCMKMKKYTINRTLALLVSTCVMSPVFSEEPGQQAVLTADTAQQVVRESDLRIPLSANEDESAPELLSRSEVLADLTVRLTKTQES